MPEHPRHPPLLVLVGPTAVGKTEVSLQLAEPLNAEIVSADSRLLYRGMDIGTAKPTPEERRRVPHHLIDVVDPDETWSLAQYQDAAYRAIEDILSRGRLPFLVGGTGQYVWAVVEGWQVPRVPPNPRLREVLERWGREIGPEALYEKLLLLDPGVAGLVQPRNLRRIVRAFEVIFATGRPFSQQRTKHPPPYRTLTLGLYRPREELYRRIDQRIEAMLQAGWLEEVKRLLDQGYGPDLPAMSGIGYAELAAYLLGRMSFEEAVARIRQRTRQFVRRQANWFRLSDPRIHWFRARPGVAEEMLAFVQDWLRSSEGEKE